jgi:hypothetical protein
MKIFKIAGCLGLLSYSLVSFSATLDQLGVKYNTDKSSIFHNYLNTYEKYLSHLKDQPITFLEIGFWHGDSARMWDEYFSKAQLHFIDIDKVAFNYMHGLSARSTLHIADQGNRQDLQNFIAKTNTSFDVILDDGGHHMHQQILSFQILFPLIKPGGLYIIEDLHTSYWSDWGSYGSIGNPRNGPGTAINFLLDLAHDVNYVGAYTGCADFNKSPDHLRRALTSFQSQIESIHFYSSVCIITKRK